jgi:hypothetical protein
VGEPSSDSKLSPHVLQTVAPAQFAAERHVRNGFTPGVSTVRHAALPVATSIQQSLYLQACVCVCPSSVT